MVRQTNVAGRASAEHATAPFFFSPLAVICRVWHATLRGFRSASPLAGEARGPRGPSGEGARPTGDSYPVGGHSELVVHPLCGTPCRVSLVSPLAGETARSGTTQQRRGRGKGETKKRNEHISASPLAGEARGPPGPSGEGALRRSMSLAASSDTHWVCWRVVRLACIVQDTAATAPSSVCSLST